MGKGWPKQTGKGWPKCTGKVWHKCMRKGWSIQMGSDWLKYIGKHWPKCMGKGNTVHYHFGALDREFATTSQCFHCIVPSSVMSWAIVRPMTFDIAPNYIPQCFPFVCQHHAACLFVRLYCGKVSKLTLHHMCTRTLYHMCTNNTQHAANKDYCA